MDETRRVNTMLVLLAQTFHEHCEKHVSFTFLPCSTCFHVLDHDGFSALSVNLQLI